MDLENTQSQMRKGILEYCILQIISQGSCYSSDILDRLKHAKLLVVEGYFVSVAHSPEKWGIVELSLGGIQIRSAAEIF